MLAHLDFYLHHQLHSCGRHQGKPDGSARVTVAAAYTQTRLRSQGSPAMAREQHDCATPADLEDRDSDLIKAPRHGLNAKALLLQAAALAAEEAADIEDSTPVTLSTQEKQIADLKAAFTHAGKLLSGVPKKETPIVAFVNNTKVCAAY